jgi:hypothetical protein
MKRVAFKVTYNDGGANGGLVGFRGVCSPSNIVENIVNRRMTWCSQKKNPCFQYFLSRFGGRPPTESNCYESTLLARQPMRFSAGYYHHGPKVGEPIPMRGVASGDLAVLTTMPPGAAQEGRIVFGWFRVGGVGKDNSGCFVESDGSMDTVLPDDVARQARFWRYYQNSDGSRKWGTGLFRYLSEQQIRDLLRDVVGLLGDRGERDVVLAALGAELVEQPVRQLPVVDGDHGPRDGYGGGESEAHLELKELVAGAPESIGLPAEAIANIEHPFVSGDQVDVMFELPDGTAAVVEIETILTYPGTHQCVKYRALLEAARGEPIGSGKVQAILVAHQFDAKTKEFASKYGIRLVRLKA